MTIHALTSPRRPDLAAAGFVAFSAVAAAIAAWICVTVNMERACERRESIAQAWCAQPAPGSGAEIDALRRRIERNPGDANAYAELALADRSPAKPKLIEVASRLAPREPNLLLHRAAAAFDRQDWPAAVEPLLELVENHDLPLAAASLAWLVQNGHGKPLEAHVAPGTRWLPRVLAATRTGRGSLSAPLPLVTRALKLGAIEHEFVRAYMRDLKEARAWADAYALWLSLHGNSVPLLFNGGFDRAFEAAGFDWEAPGAARRSGVVSERQREPHRGAVLELQFTGRTVETPIVRQHLFIGPGRYRLRGEYKTSQFRLEPGLAWTMRCEGSVAGASAPLQETRGLWRQFDFEFVIPAACGVVAALQLEPAGRTEAAVGTRGRVSFDGFSLERIGS